MARNRDAWGLRNSNTRTSLRRRKRSSDPMAAYDRLPASLRAWLAQAALPWSPQSALRVWRGALEKCENDHMAAHSYLSQLEQKKLAREHEKVWRVE